MHSDGGDRRCDASEGLDDWKSAPACARRLHHELCRLAHGLASGDTDGQARAEESACVCGKRHEGSSSAARKAGGKRQLADGLRMQLCQLSTDLPGEFIKISLRGTCFQVMYRLAHHV